MAFELLGTECAKVEVLGTEVCEMYVNGQLVFTCGDAPTPLEPPGDITNFAASDGRVNTIEMTFSGAGGHPAPTYDLYENGYKVANGISSGYDLSRTGPSSATYKVIATNSEGTSTSNENVGSSTAEAVNYPPGTITNFKASDCYMSYIEFTWASASYANSYDLYNEFGSLIESNVTSGYIFNSGYVEPYSYYVVAKNAHGSTQSNSDIGSTWSTGSGSGFSASKTLIAGTDFPADAVIDVCLIGGGVSGIAKCSNSPSEKDGGGAGSITSTTVGPFSCGESLTLSIGKGGASRTAQEGEEVSGYTGGDSTFAGITAAGGESYYSGNGEAAPSNCYSSSSYDGTLANKQNYVAYGGQGGFGNGGNGSSYEGTSATAGSKGAGGGCCQRTIQYPPAISGAGGDGYLELSW